MIGAGALGNETIKNLALLGCGKIDIYDFDIIEEHNLTRSVLFRNEDIGKEKAKVVAKRAKRLDPNINTSGYCENILTFLTPHKIQEYDIVFCCVDNFEARLYINKLCVLMRIDLINMGMDSKYQSTDFFPFGQSDDCACYECNLPYSVYGRIKKRYSCGGLKKLSFVEKKIPTTIITSSMAALGVSLGLRLGSKENQENVSMQILLDTIDGISKKNKYLKNESCPTCSSSHKKVQLVTFLDSSFENVYLDEDISFGLSQSIIKKMECKNCGILEEFNKYLYKNASLFDDSLTVCPKCNNQSVDIDISDIVEGVELKNLTSDDGLSVSYVYYENDDNIYIICKGTKDE